MSSLSSAVSILRLFSCERPELTATDASRLLAMPKSSAHRLMKKMLDEGLLASVGSTPRYRVGHLAFELSRIYARRSTLLELADGELAAICRQSGHTGYISILEGTDIVVVRVHLGTQTLRVVTPLGTRGSAFETANGRTLLARLDDDRVRALHPIRLQPRSASSPQNLDELIAALHAVRRTGSCEAIDEGVPGVGSVAVSVADSENSELLAFCVSFPAHVVGKTERKALSDQLIASARRIATQTDDAFWNGQPSPRVVAA